MKKESNKETLDLVKDIFTTDVIFLIEKDSTEDVFAFFPNDNYFHYESDTKMCYAHIGQHSACHLDYANECKEASESEYADLKSELESIGYNLNILTHEKLN